MGAGAVSLNNGGEPIGPYPFDNDPALHPALTALRAYVGLWRGRGRGGYPTIEDFDYGQEIRISHDGRPFLAYESRAWLLDAESRPVRPVGRESGWWRPVVREDRPTGELEVLLTTPTGIMELHLGRVDGHKVEIATDAVMRTSTAKEVTAGRRLYGIVDGALLYAQEMAAVGQPMAPHLSARLTRVG
jgi:THAP4-like, heme-binding beta-barrel domain